MPPNNFTRAEYMAALVSHSEYYAQFVTEATRQHVARRFTAEELRKALAKDKHLNSIALGHWERLAWHPVDPANRYRPGHSGPFYSSIPYDKDAAAEAGESITRAVLVCIAKEAARQIAEGA